jgi:hypothetical protein
VSIRARFFDESELPALVGDEVQGTLQSLVDAYGNKPWRLRFPLRMEVRISSTELPDDSMRGKTNPHPFSFTDAANAPKEAALPPRFELTLAIAQIGSAYTIGVPVKNISESPVQKVAVSFLAKADGEGTAQRIPFAPTSDEALAPGQHREFVFPFEALPALYRLVATQPTNRYGVLVEMEDERLVFPGEAVKAALTHIEHLSRGSDAQQHMSTD